MGSLIHARLDMAAQRQLARLRKATGVTDSELVRRGLQALVALPLGGNRTLVGLGSFESGKPDLGSNRAHLRGFGRR